MKSIVLVGPAESVTLQRGGVDITFVKGVPVEVPDDLHAELLARNPEQEWEDAGEADSGGDD